MAYFKVPKYWMFRSDFPKTVTGKVKKNRMREISIEDLYPKFKISEGLSYFKQKCGSIKNSFIAPFFLFQNLVLSHFIKIGAKLTKFERDCGSDEKYDRGKR